MSEKHKDYFRTMSELFQGQFFCHERIGCGAAGIRSESITDMNAVSHHPLVSGLPNNQSTP